MYKIAKIYIHIINAYKYDKIGLLMDYLSVLYKNGQILSNYNLVKADNDYIATVTTTDNDSLDDKYNLTPVVWFLSS